MTFFHIQAFRRKLSAHHKMCNEHVGSSAPCGTVAFRNAPAQALADHGAIYPAHSVQPPQQEVIFQPHEYNLSSVMIRQLVEELTQTSNEDLRFLTGFEFAPKRYAITSTCRFVLRHASAVSAAADQISMTRLLISLHCAGHKLLLTGHSHPGIGPDAATPSSIDLDFHRRLELGGYLAIGLILTRNGFVRFFSYSRGFSVVVHGDDMEVYDDNQCVYRLN